MENIKYIKGLPIKKIFPHQYSPLFNCRGGQLPNFHFFSSDFNLLPPPPPQFVKILKKSDPLIIANPQI